MKKIVVMLIAAAMVVSLMASCGDDKQQTAGQDTEVSSATELTDNTLGQIIADAAEIGDGTAGVSLKRTEIAARIISYAAKMGFSADDTEKLKEEFLTKIDALDEDKKTNVNNTFMDAFEILDKAVVDGDYDSVKGQFEDAGVSEGIDIILNAPGLRESYDTFRSAYLTMGNSDK